MRDVTDVINGWEKPTANIFSSPHTFDTQLAELRDFVESNLAAAAESQRAVF